MIGTIKLTQPSGGGIEAAGSRFIFRWSDCAPDVNPRDVGYGVRVHFFPRRRGKFHFAVGVRREMAATR